VKKNIDASFYHIACSLSCAALSSAVACSYQAELVTKPFFTHLKTCPEAYYIMEYLDLPG
jgi:hypothetical protein